MVQSSSENIGDDTSSFSSPNHRCDSNKQPIKTTLYMRKRLAHKSDIEKYLFSV